MFRFESCGNGGPRLRCSSLLAISALFALLVTPPAFATMLRIADLPIDPDGPNFGHNVFHTAGWGGGASGSTLGWFAIDTAGDSWWNTMSGAMQVDINIYANSTDAIANNAAARIGVGRGAGTSLTPGEFHDTGIAAGTGDDTIIGDIAWALDVDAGSFATYLNNHVAGFSNGGGTVTTKFVHYVYTSANSEGFQPNTYNDPAMQLTLWGADGDLDFSTSQMGDFDESTNSIGVDVAMQFALMPEPGTVTLLAAGLLGFAARLRRRKAASRM